MDPKSIPHEFEFDPTYGYDLDALWQVGAPASEPEDFDAFWRGLRNKAANVAPRVEIGSLSSPDPELELLRVDFDSYPDFRIGAWAVLPVDRSRIRRLVILGHGYGGRDQPEWPVGCHDAMVLQPVVPGFHISPDPRLPFNDCWKHVLVGIDKPEDYIIGPCAAVFWQALRVAETLLGNLPERVHYHGGSLGGGLGALMLPWEPSYQSAELNVPTFGNQPLRAACPGIGSGEPVRLLLLERPELARTLTYFDSATAIKRVRIPVVFNCACFDPAVAPPGQFAVANSHPGPKWITPILFAHFEMPYDTGPETVMHTRHQREMEQWVNARMGATA